LHCYDQAFASYFPFPDDIKSLIKCHLSQGDTTNAFQALRLLIKSGYKLDCSLPFLGKDGKRFRSSHRPALSGNAVLDSLLLKEYDSLRNEFLANNNREANEYMFMIVCMEQFASSMRFQLPSPTRKERLAIQEAGFGLKTEYLINLLKSNINLS
jgi:hypothetical protein